MKQFFFWKRDMHLRIWNIVHLNPEYHILATMNMVKNVDIKLPTAECI